TDPLGTLVRQARTPGSAAMRRAGCLVGALLALAWIAGCGPKRSSTPVPAGTPLALMPPTPATPGPDYHIQVGDELHVHFLYQPENNDQLVVRPDGRISLAAAGEIEAVGLTPTELETVIVDRASGHLKNPEVTVVVTKVGEQHVYVGGQVLKPGAVVLA